MSVLMEMRSLLLNMQTFAVYIHGSFLLELFETIYIFRVLFNTSFPISQPKCKVLNRGVYWTKVEDYESFEFECETRHGGKPGLIKCLVNPPRNGEL